MFSTAAARRSVFRLAGAPDIIYLQNHLDYLSGQRNLLFLSNEGLDYMLFLHVCKDLSQICISLRLNQLHVIKKLFIMLF